MFATVQHVLDTRGAIGVTQRADYFKRMRNMARQISALYLEQRQRLEYPFMDVWAEQPEVRQERVRCNMPKWNSRKLSY